LRKRKWKTKKEPSWKPNTKKRWTILKKKSQGLLVYSNRPWETYLEKQHIWTYARKSLQFTESGGKWFVIWFSTSHAFPTSVPHENVVNHWFYKEGISKRQDGKTRWSKQIHCHRVKDEGIWGNSPIWSHKGCWDVFGAQRGHSEKV